MTPPVGNQNNQGGQQGGQTGGQPQPPIPPQGQYNPYAQQQQPYGQQPYGQNPYAQQQQGQGQPMPPQGQQGGYNPYAQQQGQGQPIPPQGQQGGYNPYVQQQQGQGQPMPPQGQQGGYNPYAQQQGQGQPIPPQGQQGGYNPYAQQQQQQQGQPPIPQPEIVTQPIGTFGVEDGFKGLVDLLTMKAIYWKEEDMGMEFEQKPIPAEMLENCEAARDIMMAAAAEANDELLDKYLEEDSLTEKEILEGLRTRTINNEITQVQVRKP